MTNIVRVGHGKKIHDDKGSAKTYCGRAGGAMESDVLFPDFLRRMQCKTCEKAREAEIRKQEEKLLRAGKYIFRRKGLTLLWLVRPGIWEKYHNFLDPEDLEITLECILGFPGCLEATN